MAIEIWHAAAAVNQAGELETTCRQWLTPEELQQAARYRKPTTENQFVVGRGMARRLLAGRAGVEPQGIAFGFSAHGKPHLKATQPIEFNVAHTGGMVVCAIGDSARLGVDVEALDRRVDIRLAERYFSPPEVRWLAEQPADQQCACFLRIWTLKESFIKAIGTGLTMPLDQFAFLDIESQTPRLTLETKPDSPAAAHGPAQRWHSMVFTPSPGYIAAVTVESSSRPELKTKPFDTGAV